jgi:hypothetical protein
LVDNLNHFAKKVGDFFSGITSVSVSFMINFSIFLGFFYLFFLMIDKGRGNGLGVQGLQKNNSMG